MWPDFQMSLEDFRIFFNNFSFFIFLVLASELFRRFLNARINHGKDDTNLQPFVKPFVASIIVFMFTQNKNKVDSTVKIDWIYYPVIFLMTFIFYYFFHLTVTLTPSEKKSLLKKHFHNMGPGLAKGFCCTLKIGLMAEKTQETLTEIVEKSKASMIIKKYKEDENIGKSEKIGIPKSEFITDSIVILFPEDLIGHLESFDKLQKECEKKGKYDSTVAWISTNSQGLAWFDANKQGKEEDITIHSSDSICIPYKASGQPRNWTGNLIRWEYMWGPGEPMNWFFLSFDNKPLENLIEWYKAQNNLLDKETAKAIVRDQCNVYRECLEEELNSDPQTKDKFYILTYNDILSKSMPTLVKMIRDREGRLGVSF